MVAQLVEQGRGARLLGHRLQDAALATHAVEVVGGVAGPGVVQGLRAAHVVDARGQVLDRVGAVHVGVVVVVDRVQHLDVHPADGVDDGDELGEVHQGEVVDVDAQQVAEQLLGGGGPGILLPEQVGPAEAPGVDLVGDGAEAIAAGEGSLSRVPRRQGQPPQVAGDAEHGDPPGFRVDGEHDHGVGADAAAADPGIAAHQEDVDPPFCREALGQRGGGRGRHRGGWSWWWWRWRSWGAAGWWWSSAPQWWSWWRAGAGRRWCRPCQAAARAARSTAAGMPAGSGCRPRRSLQ